MPLSRVWSSPLKPVVLTLAMLAVSGCGLPPHVTVISTLLDGASFAATEKTLTDHAISELAGEDCALWRAVKEGNICYGVREQGQSAETDAERETIQFSREQNAPKIINVDAMEYQENGT